MRYRPHCLDKCGRLQPLTQQSFGTSYRRGGGFRWRYWVVCKCDCGTILPVRVDQIKNGIAQSCGCRQKEIAAECLREAATTHGQATREWHWLYIRAVNQKKRCEDPHHPCYKRYGGRGIRFCFDSPAEAVAYYRTLPNCCREMDLDRTDNSGNYERGNVRFVTHSENMYNRG